MTGRITGVKTAVDRQDHGVKTAVDRQDHGVKTEAGWGWTGGENGKGRAANRRFLFADFVGCSTHAKPRAHPNTAAIIRASARIYSRADIDHDDDMANSGAEFLFTDILGHTIITSRVKPGSREITCIGQH